jgi:DNA-binding response OmpR family regulator
MRLLVIDDDPNIMTSIVEKTEGFYIVDKVSEGEEGIYLAQVTDYDGIVVSKNLPDTCGIAVCKSLREAGVLTPILMLMGPSRSRDPRNIKEKVLSLDTGADDCLTKPFAPDEFFARLRALVRRNHYAVTGSTMCVRELVMNTLHKTVVINDIVISLRRKEYDLLEYLLCNKGNTVSKERLLDHIWEKGLDVSSNTLEVHIKTLRDKIDRNSDYKLIKTVRGFGYRIVDPAPN